MNSHLVFASVRRVWESGGGLLPGRFAHPGATVICASVLEYASPLALWGAWPERGSPTCAIDCLRS